MSDVFKLHCHLTTFFSDLEEKHASCADWSSKMWHSHLVPQLELMPCAADPCLWRTRVCSARAVFTQTSGRNVLCAVWHTSQQSLFPVCLLFPCYVRGHHVSCSCLATGRHKIYCLLYTIDIHVSYFHFSWFLHTNTNATYISSSSLLPLLILNRHSFVKRCNRFYRMKISRLSKRGLNILTPIHQYSAAEFAVNNLC
jgi:hypothetical protein